MILFIQTGGTIDKDYVGSDENHGYNFNIGEPAYVTILSKLQELGIEFQFEWQGITALRKDSLDITDDDRVKILKIVTSKETSEVDKIIITHGTDTIHQTASVLHGVKNKTIILTGSMKPSVFQNTDADFNLGMSTAAVQYLPHGIYIALNGQVVSWFKFRPE